MPFAARPEVGEMFSAEIQAIFTSLLNVFSDGDIAVRNHLCVRYAVTNRDHAGGPENPSSPNARPKRQSAVKTLFQTNMKRLIAPWPLGIKGRFQEL